MKRRAREAGKWPEGEQSPGEVEQDQLNNAREDHLRAVQALRDQNHVM